MKRFCLTLALMSAVIMSGCAYTHVTVPLDRNMTHTPSGVGEAQGTIKHLSIYAPYGTFLWDSAAVGDMAKEQGMDTIYYSDLEILRVFYVWNTYTVHIYGE